MQVHLLLAQYSNKYKRLSLLLSFSLLLSLSLFSQDHPFGSWNILNAKLSIDKHWSAWVEGQMRSTDLMNDFNYYEIKGALAYNINKSISFTGGIGHYETYTAGGEYMKPVVTVETRTWLQVGMEQQLDRINFDHRYRVEQRHLNTGYKNRFRYRLNVVVPINKPTVTKGTIFGYIGDEIFFTDKAPYYERNRFYTGLGYKFSPLLALTSGYMRQFDYKIDTHNYRNFLQIALLFSFNLKEQADHGVPKTTD